MNTPDVYTHGHHRAVVDQHARRTAATCAAHLLPHLGPGDAVLDVGCGPGSITVGLAAAVPDGHVDAFDVAPEIVATAAEAATGIHNVVFTTGDVYAIDAVDDTYDAVHAHQVLQHLTRPVEALREMRRVTRPGGLVAVRDADYGTFIHAPTDPILDRWLELYHEVAHRNGAEPDAGRHLLAWCHAAGLGEVEITSDTWTFADAESRLNWGDSWSQRILHSAIADQAIDYGLASRDDLQSISDAWKRWARQDDGFYCFIHVAALARV